LEDAALPGELTGHRVDVVQTQALQLRQSFEHADAERGDLCERHVA
jgi:hypothetical protein